ncbi:unnamed protein product, partial [Discosporangium mesarthrocarpum]
MHEVRVEVRRLAEALVADVPEAAYHPAILSVGPSVESLQALLDCAAEFILRPELTLRVARAVRPVLLDVVSRALSGVRNAPARASPMQSAAEVSEGVLVCLSRLLPAAPHILPLALNYWRTSPCPFDWIGGDGLAKSEAAITTPHGVGCNIGEENESMGEAAAKAEAEAALQRVHLITEAAHRLLSTPGLEGVRELWNWSPFFSLCGHPSMLVRWRAVGVVSSLLGLGECDRREILASVEALVPPSHLSSPTKGGAMLVAAAEKALVEEKRSARGTSNFEPIITSSVCEATSPGTIPLTPHPGVVSIGGILHASNPPPHGQAGGGGGTFRATAYYNSGSTGGRGAGSNFPTPELADSSRLTPTASARRNLSALSLAIATGHPVLLHGPAGSGKSLLAREAAILMAEGRVGAGAKAGKAAPAPSLLELHLDDQTDSKTLLGTHACTDIPGEFAWCPGALTRAAAAGRWVLIEDLDRAPIEVLAALGPLLEGRPLGLPGQSVMLRAAPGFRIFGTMTTTGQGAVTLGGAANFGALWTHVAVEPLSLEEILEVGRARHPSLPPEIMRCMLDTLLLARNALGQGGTARGNYSSPCTRGGGREVGVRDFLKLCSRVDRLHVFDTTDVTDNSEVGGTGAGAGTGAGNQEGVGGKGGQGYFWTEAQALSVAGEALDVFAGHLPAK